MSDVKLAFDAGNHLGETPVWSHRDGALWWINCEKPAEVHRWRPSTGDHQVWPLPLRIGGFVHKETGGLLLALADGIYDFDPLSGALSVRARSPLPAHIKLHECQCDRQGRLWVGSYDHHFPADRNARGGSYFRLDRSGLTPVINDIAVANGLAFSPDGRTLYAADSPKRSVQAYDLDPISGAVSNPRAFVSLAPGDGHIDGATVDAEGGYWLAVVGVGELRRYHRDGRLDRAVGLPCSNPTKAAFGGETFATLFVTSTKLTINPHADASKNGAVFSFEPGERGVPDTPFASN